MLLEDIADHLVTNSIGTLGTDIFKSILPEAVDACVAIVETPGRMADKTMGATIIFENPRFQILVRSDRENIVSGAYAEARDKAEEIYNLLDGAGPLSFSGVTYGWIEALQPPFLLERDENKRAVIATNFQVKKTVG